MFTVFVPSIAIFFLSIFWLGLKKESNYPIINYKGELKDISWDKKCIKKIIGYFCIEN